MAIHELDLSKEDNPSFYAALDRYNALTDELSEINRKLMSLKLPLLRTSRFKKELNNLAHEYRDFEKKHDLWMRDATDLINKPN